MGSIYSKKVKDKIWTLDKVREGFAKFHEEYGKYPTAHEIDDFNYLPSSRQIQRSFGGLVSLRNLIGLDVNDYTKGEIGSKSAIKIGIDGKKCENIVWELLKEKFEHKFIHIERPVDQEFKIRYDFYVYAKPRNFAVDVFRTTDIRNFINILNIKEKKYKKGKGGEDMLLYFVYFCDNIEKDRIIEWIEKRKSETFENWMIMSLEEFKKELEAYQSYRAV